jgi:hypothetical protein
MPDMQRTFGVQIAKALEGVAPKPPESDGRAAVEMALQIIAQADCEGPECQCCGCHGVAVAALKTWLAR